MKYPQYKIVLAVFDFIFLRISFSAAMQLKGVSHVQGDTWQYYVKSPEFISFFVFSLLIVMIFQTRNLYKLNIIFTKYWGKLPKQKRTIKPQHITLNYRLNKLKM